MKLLFKCMSGLLRPSLRRGSQWRVLGIFLVFKCVFHGAFYFQDRLTLKIRKIKSVENGYLAFSFFCFFGIFIVENLINFIIEIGYLFKEVLRKKMATSVRSNIPILKPRPTNKTHPLFETTSELSQVRMSRCLFLWWWKNFNITKAVYSRIIFSPIIIWSFT